jgi:hypothetical protein
MTTMSRKQFLRTLAGIGAGAIGASVLMACGSDDDEGMEPSEPNCVSNGTTATITNNHGHTINVSMADVDAAVDKTYDISGSSSHPHMVTITAAQFATLKGNTAVSFVSTSGGGHTHNVMVTCV